MNLNEAVKAAQQHKVVWWGRHIKGSEAVWENSSFLWADGKEPVSVMNPFLVSWSADEPKPEGPPDGATVVGLKFLQEDFGGLNSQEQLEKMGVDARRVIYLADKWIKVDGQGCYLGIRSGDPFKRSSSLFGAGRTGPVLAFFEAKELIENWSNYAMASYRWVRHLSKPCPERLAPGFREWLRKVDRSDFTPEHKAYATGDPFPKEEESEFEEWPLVPVLDHVCFRHPRRHQHWASPGTIRAKLGFLDFDIELPNGQHVYSRRDFRAWWNKDKKRYQVFYDKANGYTQEVTAMCARVLKKGE